MSNNTDKTKHASSGEGSNTALCSTSLYVNSIGRTRKEQEDIEASETRSLWPSFVDILGPYEPRSLYDLRNSMRSLAKKLTNKANAI